MRVLFTGGGTGGHLYPTLALARALLDGGGRLGDCMPPSGALQVKPGTPRSEHAVLFVGARGNIDQQLMARDDIPYVLMDSKPLSGKTLLASAGSMAANAAALIGAVPVVNTFQPDVIIAGGGYASAPAVVAGALLRRLGRLRDLKVVLMEANVIPGYANRQLARYANEVWGAYPDTETSRHFKEKFRLTGIPVRSELYTPMPKADARRSLGLDPTNFTILVFGGSQGARSLNVAVSGMVARRRLPPNWQVLHLTGARDFEWMAAERKTEGNANHYRMLSYLDTMGLAYWAADIAVCRCGASTMAELCTVALPAVVVPYPHASENHQAANADYLVEHGAALSMADAALNADSLYWLLVDAADPAKLETMRKALTRLVRPHPIAGMVERLVSHRVGAPTGTAA